jgi:Trk K+ transport system NAD-binding subunit
VLGAIRNQGLLFYQGLVLSTLTRARIRTYNVVVVATNHGLKRSNSSVVPSLHQQETGVPERIIVVREFSLVFLYVAC